MVFTRLPESEALRVEGRGDGQGSILIHAEKLSNEWDMMIIRNFTQETGVRSTEQRKVPNYLLAGGKKNAES
jgi:hypothetical protein